MLRIERSNDLHDKHLGDSLKESVAKVRGDLSSATRRNGICVRRNGAPNNAAFLIAESSNKKSDFLDQSRS